MRIRLYLDEDVLDHALIRALRLRDVDLLTTAGAGKERSGDEDQLRYATEQGRVLYTYNQKDFNRISSKFLAEGVSHAGIIVGIQNRYSVGEQMRRIVKMIELLTAEEMVNRVEHLSGWT